MAPRDTSAPCRIQHPSDAPGPLHTAKARSHSEGPALGNPDATTLPTRIPAPAGTGRFPLWATQRRPAPYPGILGGLRRHSEGSCSKGPPTSRVKSPCKHGEGPALGTPDANPPPARQVQQGTLRHGEGPALGTSHATMYPARIPHPCRQGETRPEHPRLDHHSPGSQVPAGMARAPPWPPLKGPRLLPASPHLQAGRRPRSRHPDTTPPPAQDPSPYRHGEDPQAQQGPSPGMPDATTPPAQIPVPAGMGRAPPWAPQEQHTPAWVPNPCRPGESPALATQDTTPPGSQVPADTARLLPWAPQTGPRPTRPGPQPLQAQ
ncbi:proline-rich protein 36-like [Oryctolagus cuniculus]|uniref:proline-rich protein 36-like n=1 Tax=Oryctolagus cuniculus TaxID=9986 RepID=UPI00387A5CC9